MKLILIIIILIIIILIIIPLKVIICFDLEGYRFKIYKFKIYQRKYNEIKDINEERIRIRFFRIFKLIDIQRVNLDIGGFTNYYNRAINYGIIHSLFNIFSFVIQDQFIFNYNLDFYSDPKLKFECIIKSNLGKIIVGLLKRRIIKWENIQLMIF